MHHQELDHPLRTSGAFATDARQERLSSRRRELRPRLDDRHQHRDRAQGRQHRADRHARACATSTRSAAATGPRRTTSFFHRPSRYVPRELTFEVGERMNAARRGADAARPRSTRRDVAGADAADVEAVAVCFLHAYANPAHEAAHGRDAARDAAGRVRLAVARDRARVPRVRAHLDDRRSTPTSARASARYLGRLESACCARGLRRPAAASCSPTAA